MYKCRTRDSSKKKYSSKVQTPEKSTEAQWQSLCNSSLLTSGDRDIISTTLHTKHLHNTRYSKHLRKALTVVRDCLSVYFSHKKKIPCKNFIGGNVNEDTLTIPARAMSVLWTWVWLTFSKRSLASKISWGFRPYSTMARTKFPMFSSCENKYNGK